MTNGWSLPYSDKDIIKDGQVLLEIYGEITEEKVHEFIHRMDKFILCHKRWINAQDSFRIVYQINSSGGDVNATYVLLTKTSMWKEICPRIRVETIGIGKIYSAAVLVFLIGDTRIMSELSEIYLHNSTGSINTSTIREVTSYANRMNIVEQNYIEIVCRRTGQDNELINQMILETKLLLPEEAIKLGFATEIHKLKV